MEFERFLKGKNKYPILFIGSGISRRYLNAPNWEELLKECFALIGLSDRDYQAKKNILLQKGINTNDILLELSEEMIKYYEENYLKIDDLNKTTCKVAERVTSEEKGSRFKELVCQVISGYSEHQLEDEISSLGKTSAKVYTYITTNYDDFINNRIATDREVIVGNDVILKDPIKSVYKIHGCMSDSDSIVISTTDYNKFKENNILLFSQLISFCINQPIIFLGYSLSDANIREILETIFSFVKPNSSEYEKIKENFIIIEYKQGESETKVIDKMYQVGDNTITIKAVETDNYKNIYDAISKMEIPMAISELRKLKNITKKIEMVERDAPSFKISNNLEGHDSDDLVLMLSLENDIIPLHVKTKDIINKYWDYEENDHLRKQTGIHTIPSMDVQTNQFFPSFIFRDHCDMFLEMQENKIKQYVSSNADMDYLPYGNLNQILNDTSIGETKRKKLIFLYIYHDKASSEELKNLLLSDSLDLNSTDYNRLITLYDYKKYAC